MNRYLVIREYTCPTCDGERRLWDPNWQEANAAYDAACKAAPQPSEGMTEDEVYEARSKANDAGWAALQTFWRERGYYLQSRWPPEDYECPDCEGTGLIREDMPLADALAALQNNEEVS